MNRISKIVSIIMIFMIFLLVIISIVKAVNYDYYLNYSILPFSTTKDIILGGEENLTVYINYGNFTYGVDNITFITNVTDLIIEINITKNTPVKNYTDIVIITGSLNNISYDANLTFNFFVINDTPIPETEYVQIDINEFEYTVCDYGLPWNTTKDIVVEGRHNQVIQTDYNSRFFTLLEEFTIPQENYTIIDVLIHLDKNLTIGEYVEKIKFNIVSQFSNVTFHFNIIDCLIPPPDINELLEYCRGENLSIEDYLKCINAQAKYWGELYKAVAEAQEKKIVNQTIIEYVNFTEYVDVLPMTDPEVIRDIRGLPVAIKQLISDNREKDNKLQQKDTELADLRTEREKIFSEAEKRMYEKLDPLIQDNKLKQNTINYLKNKTVWKSTLWLFGFLFAAIGCCVGGYVWYKENYFW